jgi:hypothetical protein
MPVRSYAVIGGASPPAARTGTLPVRSYAVIGGASPPAARTGRSALAWALAIALPLSACERPAARLYKASVEKPGNISLFFALEDGGGNAFPRLSVDAFRIYEDDELLSPGEGRQSLLAPESVSVHLTLVLLDLSGNLTAAQTAAGALVDRLVRDRAVAVLGFDGRAAPIPLVGFTKQPGAARNGLAALASFRPEEPAANLHGAIIEALAVLDKQLESAAQPLRFATLIVYTEGLDRAERVAQPAVLEAIQKSQADVIMIAAGPAAAENVAAELKKIAVTKLVTAERPADLTGAVETVAAAVDGAAAKLYLFTYCSRARLGVHALKLQAIAGGKKASFEYAFDADGFSSGCDPNRAPAFAKSRLRLQIK